MTSDPRSGFALPAVLTVTGVVTLIFLVAITALTSLTNESRSARERVSFLERALTAEAMLEYLAATEPFSGATINAGGPRTLAFADSEPTPLDASGMATPIHLDGRPYQIAVDNRDENTLVLSLRDQAGMINIAQLNDDQFLQLGEMIGLAPNISRRLGPLYTDYVDIDDLETINGAERIRYGGDGPANRSLRRPAEFLSILGVRESVDRTKWRSARDELAADARSRSLNINTAGPKALQVWFGLNAQQAQSVIAARERSPFLSFSDFAAAGGGLLIEDPETIYTFPAGRIVYEIADQRSRWRYRARLVLTPSSGERPVWVDQTEMTEAAQAAMARADATRFPYTPR